MKKSAATVAAALVAGMALAHAGKEATTPPDGAVIAGSPEMIHMVFDAPMRITFVRLLDEGGAPVPLERETDMAPAMEFHAVPATLAPGAYRVEWRGLAADGHPMDGAFGFTVE